MADNDLEKLFNRLLRQTSRSLALERMRATGFWPADQGLPPDPPEEREERERIAREIEQLTAEREEAADPAKALAAERERRWEASRQRRAEARAERERRKAARLAEWEEERAARLVHAGLGVSAGLQGEGCDAAALEARGLPLLHTAADLAAGLEIPLARLRWLTFHRKGATLVHYHRYEVPKKAGGMRVISAPKPELARAQRWVLRSILDRLEVEPEAHGFVGGRSIVTNATPHRGRAVVVNLDVRDFFPSVTFRRVKGLFAAIGYGEQVATVLALLCTEPPRLPLELRGTRYYVALGERRLPQGASTSPALANAVCRRLDRRLRGLASRHGFAYTRYADDLSFSGDDDQAVGRLLRSARTILGEEGLFEHESKTRVMRQGRRQEVTGVTVNQKLGVGRRGLRQLRAVLHNAARHGLESQNRADHPNFAAYLRGRVEYACMVDSGRRPALMAALERALGR